MCRRAGSSEATRILFPSTLLQTAAPEDHWERSAARLCGSMSLYGRGPSRSRASSETPRLRFRKVLTNFSRATSSDEIQYTAGHLAVCAAATHTRAEECGLFQGGFCPPRGHLTFMWKPSKISLQELTGGKKMNEFFSFLPLTQSGRVKRILLRL